MRIPERPTHMTMIEDATTETAMAHTPRPVEGPYTTTRPPMTASDVIVLEKEAATSAPRMLKGSAGL